MILTTNFHILCEGLNINVPATSTDLFCLSFSLGTSFSFGVGLSTSVVALP